MTMPKNPTVAAAAAIRDIEDAQINKIPNIDMPRARDSTKKSKNALASQCVTLA